VPIGLRLKFSTRKLSTLGVMKAGRLGPILMFLIPSCSRVRMTVSPRGGLLGKFGIAVTPRFGAITAADQAEMLDHSEQ